MAAALLLWSWRKWTDVHVDFGNELYIAWRLSEGEALYRDIAHRNGPLSHYANAALFRVFGVSLRVLVVANLAVLAGICAMALRLLTMSFGRLAASVAVAVLLGVFAFSQYVGIANFNYVTPYHHFQTHGIALCFGMLLAFDRAATRGGNRWLAVAGACLGAVFLTKAELFVPALATAIVGGTLHATGRWGRPVGPRGALAFGTGLLAPPIVFGIGLALQTDPGTALRGILGNWAHLGEVLADPFYRATSGLAEPARGLARIATAIAWLGGFALGAALLDRAAHRIGPSRAQPWLAGALTFAGALAFRGWVPWLELAAALPVTTALAVMAYGARAWRAAAEPLAARGATLALLGAVLGLGLLGKLLLAARFAHYGFVLAMPATLWLVAAGVAELPTWLRRRGSSGATARAVVIAIVATFVVSALEQSQRIYAIKTLEVGRGSDAILAEAPSWSPRAQIVAQTLDALAARMSPGDTLLVLPEGISLNYWLRSDNPTRFDLFLPTEIAAFGEAEMLADLAAHPPDFVVLAHRVSGEFGVGAFGVDPRNGRGLLDWVNARYRRVARIGAEPFGNDGFGCVILERRRPQEPVAYQSGEASRSLR